MRTRGIGKIHAEIAPQCQFFEETEAFPELSLLWPGHHFKQDM
jgi:hypothetical protein